MGTQTTIFSWTGFQQQQQIQNFEYRTLRIGLFLAELKRSSRMYNLHYVVLNYQSFFFNEVAPKLPGI